MIEIKVPSIDVEIVDEVVATSTGNVDIETVDLDDLAVTVAKKEYVITGDSIYVPVLYDDAPQWMKDLVGLAVEASMETANAESLARLTQILSEFATGYVPLNQYTQSILDLSNADQSLQVFIETMNSNYDDGISEANSQIIDLQTTKASKAEVVTQVVDTIAAQLATPGSSLAAVVARLDQAIVDETSARANSMEMLTAQIENVDSGVIANAEVLNTALAYVGIDEAGAETGGGLSAYLVDGSGNVGGATSKVANNVYVDALGNVKSKYEYNSTVSVNGSNYNSGFGLSNSSGTAIGSEFWINADKLKFTNSGKTGTKVPFSIDASGPTPQITFNGNVTFSAVDSVYNSKVDSNNDALAQRLGYVNYADMIDAANSGHTVINGGYLRTDLIQANDISASKINTTNLVVQKVAPVSPGSFEISAFQDAGPAGDKNYNIYGARIYGASIYGGVIRGAFIDHSSSNSLTNWVYVTNIAAYAGYEGNFAKDSNGNLLVVDGYYRLANGVLNYQEVEEIVTSTSAPYAYSFSWITLNILVPSVGIYPYDCYKIAAPKRLVSNSVNLVMPGVSYITPVPMNEYDGEFKLKTNVSTSRHTLYYAGFGNMVRDDTYVYIDTTVVVFGRTLKCYGYIWGNGYRNIQVYVDGVLSINITGLSANIANTNTYDITVWGSLTARCSVYSFSANSGGGGGYILFTVDLLNLSTLPVVRAISGQDTMVSYQDFKFQLTDGHDGGNYANRAYVGIYQPSINMY